MKYKKLWAPGLDRVENSQMQAFMNHVNSKYGLNFDNYHELHQWSIENIADFWGTFFKFSDIVYSKEFTTIVDDASKMPDAKWFQGATLNFAENLLKHRDDRTAIIFRGENGKDRHISFRELYSKTHEIAEGLRKIGVTKGDRVGAFMPNIPETIIAMLATASIGAIWSSSSPDFGIKGVLDRFSQIEPKVIFSIDGYIYSGKRFDSQEKLLGILSQLP
ncbi:MAG: AMP-binding protein [Bacteroidales bacterium]|nr:AMP-binding protein [Bacteroidales bacterium]